MSKICSVRNEDSKTKAWILTWMALFIQLHCFLFYPHVIWSSIGTTPFFATDLAVQVIGGEEVQSRQVFLLPDIGLGSWIEGGVGLAHQLPGLDVQKVLEKIVQGLEGLQTALACQIKQVRHKDQLAVQTRVLTHFDDEDLSKVKQSLQRNNRWFMWVSRLAISQTLVRFQVFKLQLLLPEVKSSVQLSSADNSSRKCLAFPDKLREFGKNRFSMKPSATFPVEIGNLLLFAFA